MAKENNCGDITAAQEAGRTTKSHAQPDPPRQKPGIKPSTKHKQAEVITIDDDAGGDGASEPSVVPKPGPKPSAKPSPKPM